MTTNEPTSRKPLRLWPGVGLAVLTVIASVVIPVFTPGYAMYGWIGAFLLGLLIILWWLLFSRARWYERLAAVPLIFLVVYAVDRVVHPSVSGGAQGYMTYMLAIPTLAAALVGWAAVSRRLSAGPRAAAVVVAALLGCLPWMLVRTGGISNIGRSDLHFRWTPTPEERLLALADEPKPLPPAPAPAAAEIPKPAIAATPEGKPAKETAAAEAAKVEPAAAAVPAKPAEWPGFRGPDRDGVIHGTRVATDWSQSPPVQAWRRPIGPGWSSFAVNGNVIYTQEQRGGDEVVSAYNLTTGEPVWRHKDATRFWESNGGAGPRGTPTLSGGRVYSIGATGVVNVLDATTGVGHLVAQCREGAQREDPVLGHLELAAGR